MADTDNKCSRNSDKSNWALKFRGPEKASQREQDLKEGYVLDKYKKRGNSSGRMNLVKTKASG